MSNNRIPLVFYVFLSAFLLNGATVAFSQFVEERHPEDTQESAFSFMTEEAPPPAPVPVGKPITVTDVVVDKTDKNAVVARDGAIVEAQRKAFQVVAEKSMSAEAFKTYKLPDSKTIAMLVDNFEIKNEQLSSTRYVASFTVRFLSEINNYLSIPSDIGKTISAGPPAAAAATEATTSATPDATAPVAARTVLILPYYEGAAGRKLWEDPNPWRDAWQEAGNSASAWGLTVAVPTGDLADVSLGDTEAAWQGNYAVIEKARTIYSANEVALVVAQVPVAKAFGLAGKTGTEGVDLYLYKDGKLERLKFIEGKLGSKDAYKKAIAKVVDGLKMPVPYDEPAADAVAPPPPPEKTAAPSETEKQEGERVAASAGGSVAIAVTMNFADYAQWMEAQRRISEILPPVDIEISRLTKGQAQFRMDYTGGDLAAFRTVLAGKGLELERPVVEVDESVLGSVKPTQKTVYELRLQN